MLHLPMPMLMGGESLTPYQAWLAHVTALAGGNVVSSGSNTAFGSAVVAMQGAIAGDMVGSPWLHWTGSTNRARAIQHSLPSEAEYLDQVTRGRGVYVRVVAGSLITSYNSVNRNGYESLAYSDGLARTAQITDRAVFWSGTDLGGEPLETNPSAGTGPTLYTWS